MQCGGDIWTRASLALPLELTCSTLSDTPIGVFSVSLLLYSGFWLTLACPWLWPSEVVVCFEKLLLFHLRNNSFVSYVVSFSLMCSMLLLFSGSRRVCSLRSLILS